MKTSTTLIIPKKISAKIEKLGPKEQIKTEEEHSFRSSESSAFGNSKTLSSTNTSASRHRLYKNGQSEFQS